MCEKCLDIHRKDPLGYDKNSCSMILGFTKFTAHFERKLQRSKSVVPKHPTLAAAGRRRKAIEQWYLHGVNCWHHNFIWGLWRTKRPRKKTRGWIESMVDPKWCGFETMLWLTWDAKVTTGGRGWQWGLCRGNYYSRRKDFSGPTVSINLASFKMPRFTLMFCHFNSSCWSTFFSRNCFESVANLQANGPTDPRVGRVTPDPAWWWTGMMWAVSDVFAFRKSQIGSVIKDKYPIDVAEEMFLDNLKEESEPLANVLKLLFDQRSPHLEML